MSCRLLLAAALILLPAGSCEDNLGDNEPRPITFRVSAGPNGVPANGPSDTPGISGDGNLVVFASNATNLAFPSTSFKEIFLKDRSTEAIVNITKLADLPPSVTLADCENPDISPNGRYIVFSSSCTMGLGFGSPQSRTNVFRYDRMFGFLNAAVTASWPGEDCQEPSVSDNGLVAFQSRAGNLGFANAGRSMIYVADIDGGLPPPLTLVSHAAGSPANGQSSLARIAGDGVSVVFCSSSTDMIAPASTGFQVFRGTSAGAAVEIVSRATGGGGAYADADSIVLPAVSRDGRFVAFGSEATNLGAGAGVDAIYVRDRTALTTTVVATDGYIAFSVFENVGVSDDGAVVAYRAADDQIHVRNLATGVSLMASVGITGAPGNNPMSFNFPALSGDGRWVAWHSQSDNLVLEDTNLAIDVFGHGPVR